MKLLIISGSQRDGSQSRRVADFLVKRATALGYETNILDLYTANLPMYDDTEKTTSSSQWQSVKPMLEQAEGYFIVAPEWNGSAPPVWRNLLLYAEKTMAHKPYAACGVSAGRGGIHVIDDLRASGVKNTRLVMSPENLVASQVESLELEGDHNEDSMDFWFKSRSDYAITILGAYSEALKRVRDSGVIDHEHFPSGI